MRFVLQLRTGFKHPFRMKFNTKISNIHTCPTKSCVTFYPTWRQKITEIKMKLKSKDFPHLRQRQPIMIVIHLKRFCARIWLVLVSYHATSIRVRKPPSIKVLGITTCCARSLECLSASINFIAQKIALEKVPTRNPSRKAWEES